MSNRCMHAEMDARPDWANARPRKGRPSGQERTPVRLGERPSTRRDARPGKRTPVQCGRPSNGSTEGVRARHVPKTHTSSRGSTLHATKHRMRSCEGGTAAQAWSALKAEGGEQ